MRLNRWTTWVWVVVVLAIIALMVSRSRRAVEVDVAMVERGSLTVTIDEAATTRVRNRIDVAAPVTGRFLPVGMRVGDEVSRGLLIGTLQSAPLDPVTEAQARQRVAGLGATLNAARTRIEGAQAAADIATRDAQRASRLYDAGAIARRELDQAQAAATAATNDLRAALERIREVEAELAAAEAVVAATGDRGGAVRVVAPRRGRILRVYEENTRVVLAGSPLLQIGDLDELEAVIPILSADAPRVIPGATVRYVLSARGDTLRGKVRMLEPAAFTKYSALGVEEQRVNVIATVTDTSRRLGDQFRLDARITVWEAEGVLLVAASALVRDGDAWSVFAVRDGRAARVPVELGERTADAAEVRAGLAEGDQVIQYPGDAIADGVRVRARSGA